MHHQITSRRKYLVDGRQAGCPRASGSFDLIGQRSANAVWMSLALDSYQRNLDIDIFEQAP